MASFAVVNNTNMSLISAIRNLVCPLCGASMMGFRCLGYCRGDWRPEWERARCAGSKRKGLRSGKSCAKHRV
jgi:predicted amidophosphoribosyltransferase